ncbi:hypothetical protein WICANDRAFT_27817 [Wickerhamomyces anomalus NRRL Y-366-8]|uniref:Zn(2)-C6 fungal-type domain-containing protein n=1 Tax=Wickerhamomyces anomalus (strain ATCC 58044 / CBS 1984 / NCYC 433 / NRRL Y-366-8) TaxID=683960 RepID=A0A1E3P6W6_WICAA|nr:uncharacterized protein WICANDRAFT_27817 [Wickerhamomyces anomalus NRRL Y-366-8]ODQ61169.1 hypothetical protein WICANDRAFT_27817 [Wickerhamomyces anomalus NRRL Y-366-8]
MSAAPLSKPGGKKSHACGPCRRLKRKCDLQIPCGTCKSGRNTKIDECMANPARPLNNIQELIAPNLKFGRVQKRSPEGFSNNNGSAINSSTNSPNVKRQSKSSITSSDGSSNGNGNTPKRLKSVTHEGSFQTNFSQFDIKAEQESPAHHQNSVSSNSTDYPPQHYQQPYQQQQHIPIQNPLVPNHQQQQMLQTHSQIQSPSASYDQAASQQQQQQTHSAPPLPQYQYHQQVPVQPNPYAPMNYSQPSPAPQQHQQMIPQVAQAQIPSTKNDYKTKYLNLLPSQIQTTVLVNFYLQNIDYIYHPLHHPSFRAELENFWLDQEKVDVGWLAVLFMVLALAAIHLPKGLINITSQEIEKSHKIWFEASRECINIWDSMQTDPTKFNIYTLQCFSLCQLYFYATKRAEALIEILEKAIKDCLKMGLDKDDSENPNLLEVQMKRRLWWDVCGCDSFRSLSLGVKPLIRSYSNTVPLPANANDTDITKESIKIRSSSIATDNSFNIYRAQMMKILNGIYEKEHEIHEQISSTDLKNNLEKVEDQLFKGLIEIDIELCDSSKGWFFQMDKFGNLPSINDPKIQFQHHMLHTCICIHRFRIYQNYLSDDIPIAWEVGVTSARALFEVYKRLRKIYDLKNPLFLSQIHQSFTGSIIQSMLLLLNHKISLEDQNALYGDIDWMLKDLEVLGREVFILKPEVLKESFKVLNALKKSINKNLVELEKDQKDIVSNVFGGKDMTENYLQKCTVSFIIDKVDRRASNEPPAAEKNDFDYENQLGTSVSSDLIGKSVEKFNQVRSLKSEANSKENSMEKQLKLLKAQAMRSQESPQQNIDPTQQVQPQQPTAQIPQSAMTVQDPGFPLQQPIPLTSSSSEMNNNNGTDGFVRQGTPIEINLSGIDSFWNDVGPQGIDELNNMYYSEFSGYRIA